MLSKKSSTIILNSLMISQLTRAWLAQKGKHQIRRSSKFNTYWRWHFIDDDGKVLFSQVSVCSHTEEGVSKVDTPHPGQIRMGRGGTPR